MIGYIIILVIVSIFVSIVTEQMLIRRLQLSEGVEISRGKCHLKKGYGLIISNDVTKPPVQHDIGEFNSARELSGFYKPLR